jgi:hypothetical protein
MRRPQRTELEFTILRFVAGGGMIYGLFVGAFEMVG